MTPIAPNAASNPSSGYMVAGLAFDLTTTAVYSGPATVCFNLDAITGNAKGAGVERRWRTHRMSLFATSAIILRALGV